MPQACLGFIDDFSGISFTICVYILKKLFLPVVLYGRQMLFQLDMHVQNFEYICPIYMT